MKALQLKSTIIISYEIINHLISRRRCAYLDRFKINDYNFIVGPLLINTNHWVALIINLKDKIFFLLDPQNQFANFETEYECWINYYNNRRDADYTIAWHKDTVSHPVQEDYFNCGVFTVNFITEYINKGKIDFKTTTDQLFLFRKQIANEIKRFYSLFILFIFKSLNLLNKIFVLHKLSLFFIKYLQLSKLSQI